MHYLILLALALILPVISYTEYINEIVKLRSKLSLSKFMASVDKERGGGLSLPSELNHRVVLGCAEV